jgi:hypothetical protein
MIALNSRDGGTSFQVHNEGELIGHIRRQSGLTGDKYLALALVDKDCEEETSEKAFDSPHDALQWIGKYKGKKGSGSFA